MSWICNICGVNNANLNLQCVYCKKKNGIITPRPALETFDESESLLLQCEIWRIYITLWKTGANMSNMTLQEELFAKFFNHEKVLVKDMDDLTLRAHREELQLIAKEARARLWAVDEEQQERTAKNKKSKGFIGSVSPDELSTEAINTINERKSKMSKIEKQIENLMKLPGIDRATAERMLSASTIKQIQNRKPGEAPITVETFKKQDEEKEKAGFVNPFASSVKTEAKPSEESAQAIIQQYSPKEEEKKPFVNPFAK